MMQEEGNPRPLDRDRAGTPPKSNTLPNKKSTTEKERDAFIRKSWVIAAILIQYILDGHYRTPSQRNQFYWKMWKLPLFIKNHVWENISGKIDHSDCLLLQAEFKEYGDRQQGFLLSKRLRKGWK
jgi:hypothetical protein